MTHRAIPTHCCLKFPNKAALICLIFLVHACMSPLLGQDVGSSIALKSQGMPLHFTPESQGRRQISFRTVKEGYQWRLRIPERVFCDEGVLVGHDIHRVHTPVRWTKGNQGSWLYRRANREDTSRESISLNVEYSLQIEPTTFGANLVLSIKNTSERTLHNVTGHVCLGHLKDPFRDPEYERTFIRRQKKYLNLHQTQRGTNPIRAHYLVKGQSPIKPFDNPANRFWGPLSPRDCRQWFNSDPSSGENPTCGSLV